MSSLPFPFRPCAKGDMEGGEEKSGHDPDDPAGFPCILPKADAQIHSGHDTPIGTCEPADLPVEHFFVGGVILKL